MILDLGNGASTQLDDDDSLRLAGTAVRLGHNGYAYIGRATTLHSWVLGGTRRGFHIDHINGDKLDNRRANLRFVSFQANQVNRRRLSRANTSGMRGVSPFGSRWRAQITVDRKNLHLGCFATADLAMEARRSAELRYYGELCP